MTRGLRIALGTAGIVVLIAAGVGAYLATHPRALAPGLPFARSTKPADLSSLRFEDGSGRARSISDYRGKLVVLNLWATWCAPCREEMPALDRLQGALRGSRVEVVALSVDQQGLPIVRKFFGEMGVKSLEPFIDPTAQAAFKLAVVGLPATLLVDADGRELGRHAGAVKWDAPEVVEGLRKLEKEASR